MISTYKVVWCRQLPEAGETCPPHIGLPDWTPCPRADNPEVLTWWLKALDIPVPRIQDYEALDRAVRQLQEGMCMRWSHDVHSEDKLRELLIVHLW